MRTSFFAAATRLVRPAAAAAALLVAGSSAAQTRAIIFTDDFREDVLLSAEALTGILAAQGIVADTQVLFPFTDPGDLDAYECAFDLRVDYALDSVAGFRLAGLAQDGGGIYLAGEHAFSFAFRNTSITDFATSLGGGPVQASPFGTPAPEPIDNFEPTNPDHPLATDCNTVTEVDYDGVANGQIVVPGNGTWVTGSPFSAATVAFDAGDLLLAPDGRLVIALDINYLSTGISGTLDFTEADRTVATQNRAYAENLTQWLCNRGATCACAPENHGWWHRECLGAQQIDPGRRGHGRGPGPSPRAGSYQPSTFAAADAAMARHGIRACQALDEGPFSDPRLAALRELATLHLNMKAGFLSGSCPVELHPVDDSEGLTVGSALALMEERIALGTDEAYREAAWIGEHVANGEALR